VVIAATYGVAPTAVASWIDDGLPVTSSGDIDPMVCCNWLSWGRLDRAPALARRWRRYLDFFAVHRAGADYPRQITWQRRHRLYVPPVQGTLTWWLPDPCAHVAQEVVSVGALGTMGRYAEPVGAGQELRLDMDGGATIELSGTAVVAVAPQMGHVAVSERMQLRRIVAEVVADFRYLYRRHRRDDGEHPAPSSGTCLDCARLLQQRLAAAGRVSRLVAGLIAADDLANPHYWLEVEVADGRWVPIDPSLAAIARMLGEDWQTWIDPWLGGCDARRITLALGPDRAGAAMFCSPAPGRAIIQGPATSADAWACQDWVCGATDAHFGWE
jgi:transglutaminase-like putative cysteine protease